MTVSTAHITTGDLMKAGKGQHTTTGRESTRPHRRQVKLPYLSEEGEGGRREEGGRGRRRRRKKREERRGQGRYNVGLN